MCARFPGAPRRGCTFTSMESAKEIDLKSWPRREAYEMFKNYDDPFWNVTVQQDVDELWSVCRVKDVSFHHVMLYVLAQSVNNYAPMRLRRRGEKVFELSPVHVGCSVLRDDQQSFSFAYYPHEKTESLLAFLEKAGEITRRAAAGEELDPRHNEDNLIYATTLPWIAFTDFKHAERGGMHSIPKIVFGKVHPQEGRMKMPFSVEVDHALMDGLHMSQYLEVFENEIETAVKSLR